jgi:hypothetical protein
VPKQPESQSQPSYVDASHELSQLVPPCSGEQPDEPLGQLSSHSSHPDWSSQSHESLPAQAQLQVPRPRGSTEKGGEGRDGGIGGRR